MSTATATTRSTNIRQRRRLSELFRTGVEIRFIATDSGPQGRIGPFVDPDSGRKIPAGDGDVCMFIRPPDPVQRDMALREANAKRARALVKAKRDEDSEEYLTAMAFIVDMESETLIDYVLMGDAGTRRGDAEREVLALEEWKDMTAYQDSMRQFGEMDPHELENNEEFEAIMELDAKFGSQVAQREAELADAQREVLRMELHAAGRESLERKAMERRAELIGNQAYIHEYERQMRFYAVRDADNIDLLFFERVEELASQPDEVQELIMEALVPFITEGDEAKNSRRVASGSDSSELPEPQETSEVSTPEAPSE
jgi:hypothetical protein